MLVGSKVLAEYADTPVAAGIYFAQYAGYVAVNM